MREIKFRAWHTKEKKMYFRGYQKLSHILLCDNDLGENDGKGIPVLKVSYEDCELLESTDLKDRNGQEIFEGDIVEIGFQGKAYKGVVGPIPDMFRSRGLHPLHELLAQYGIPDDAQNLEIEVIGNRFQTN